MADIIDTDFALTTDNFPTTREVISQEDTPMRDDEATFITPEDPTATTSTETQRLRESTASKHETLTDAAAEATPIEVSKLEMPPPLQPLHSMDSPEAFTPEQLAMQRNPMVTADPSMAGSRSVMNVAESPPHHSQHEESTCIPDSLQETSVTGWLVPPPAALPNLEAEPSPDLNRTTGRPSRITFDDYLSLSEITFEWGDSYDDKDWTRLSAILAPTLMVDYTDVNGHKWDAMPAEDFVGIMSHIGFVGDPLVHTQHHIGASKWLKISDEEVVGHHQLRAAHQRYTALDRKTVENKGHGHAMIKHIYRKVNGEWKLAGLRPTVRWNEFEYEKIFKGF